MPLIYTVNSLHKAIPWMSCNNTWNSENCSRHEDYDVDVGLGSLLRRLFNNNPFIFRIYALIRIPRWSSLGEWFIKFTLCLKNKVNFIRSSRSTIASTGEGSGALTISWSMFIGVLAIWLVVLGLLLKPVAFVSIFQKKKPKYEIKKNILYNL